MRWMMLLLFIFVCFSCLKKQDANGHPKVIGGIETMEEFKDDMDMLSNIVVFLSTEEGVIVGSGVYFYPGWVLTARHVVDGRGLEITKVGQGRDSASPTQVVEVDKIYRHEYDVALIKLRRGFGTSYSLLVSGSYDPINIYAAGFGIDSVGQENDLDYKPELKISRLKQGNVEVNGVVEIMEYSIISEEAGIPCLGDSGGPVLAASNNQLSTIGVLVAVSGGACAKWAGGYVLLVNGIQDWISLTMGMSWKDISR